MTIKQMQYFIVVAECCNFREAAEKIYISQQALSKQIQALENETGVQLFVRHKKTVYLTEAGKHLLKVWKPLLTELEDSLEKAKTIQGKEKIIIGIPDISGVVDVLVPFIRNELEEGSRVEYVVDSINHLVVSFLKREIDILVFFQADLQTMKIPLFYVELRKMPYGVICHRNHFSDLKEEITVDALINETIYYFDTSYTSRMMNDIKAQFVRYQLQPKELKGFSSWRNMELALRMDQGITMTYEAFLSPKTDDLIFIPLSDEEDTSLHNLVAVWTDEKQKTLSERLKQAFI